MATEGKKGGKKAKKQQKQTLGQFLGVAPAGTSWADDEEDIPAAPAQESSAREASSWRGGGSVDQQRPFANQGSKVLPNQPPYTLHVSNLAFSATEEEVQQFFPAAESVRLVMDKLTGQPKGHGYVTFPARDDLANALNLDGQSLGGRTIRLEVADNRGGKGKGGGGGFGEGSGGFGNMGAGRDFMGTGQVERAERPERGGGKGGGFGGGASWDMGRDAMGSGVIEDRPGGGRGGKGGGGLSSFSRDAMGSENTGGGGFGGRRGFGEGDGWSAGRDAMGTGVVEERRPPPRDREDRPPREMPAFSRDSMASEQPTREERPARGGPSRLMFGGAETAPSRDIFGAEEAPEKPEILPEKPRPEPWRPGGKGGARAAPADFGDGGNWRAGPSSNADNKAGSSLKTEKDDKTKQIYQPKNKQTSQELETKKEKPPPKVPLTPEELFQMQIAKTQKREQQAKAAKEKSNVQANSNPWEALGKTKKKAK